MSFRVISDVWGDTGGYFIATSSYTQANDPIVDQLPKANGVQVEGSLLLNVAVSGKAPKQMELFPRNFQIFSV